MTAILFFETEVTVCYSTHHYSIPIQVQTKQNSYSVSTVKLYVSILCKTPPGSLAGFAENGMLRAKSVYSITH